MTRPNTVDDLRRADRLLAVHQGPHKGRPNRLRPGTHVATPDDAGRCVECGERLEHGRQGQGRVGWRHSRWAA